MEDMAEQPQEEFVNSVPVVNSAPVEEATAVGEAEDLFDAPPEDAPLMMGGEMPVGVNAAAPPVTEDVFSSAPAAPADDFTAAAPLEGAPLPAITFSQPSNALELYQTAQYERLQTKEASEKAEKEQRREVAKKEKEDLYTQRVKELEAKRRSNRENQTARVFQMDSSVSLWENVYNLVDMSSKVAEGRTDLKRMRQMLLKLKHEPPVVASN